MSTAVSQAYATGGRTTKSSVAGGGTGEEPVERDPRVANLPVEVQYADLPDDMQQKIIEIAGYAVEEFVLVPTQKPWRTEEIKLLEREIERTSLREISHYIKKEIEKEYGPTWHVIYGRSFATYVTHERMNFFHFTLDGAQIVVWRHGR